MKDGAEGAEEDPAGERPRAGARRAVPRRRAAAARSRAGVRGQLARVIGLVATLVLLGVGVAVVLTLTRDSDASSAQETFAPTATATATAAAKDRKAKGPAAPRLTNAQKESRSAAVGQMRSQGFEPVAISTYDPRQSLRVLIGRPKASSTGVRGRRAFFFAREQYLGTDAASPSLRLKVASQKGSQITLAYTALRRRRQALLPQRRHGQGALQARRRAPDADGPDPARRRAPPARLT